MQKFLIYSSLTKKFKLKINEKVHHSLDKYHITIEQMQKAQDKPDLWVLIDNSLLEKPILIDHENQGIACRKYKGIIPITD